MRVPVYLSVSLVVVACCIGWYDHHRLVAAREDHAGLERDAVASGISISPPPSAGPDRSTRRPRIDMKEAAGTLALEWLDWHKTAALLKEQGEGPDESMQDRESGLWERSTVLNGDGWTTFVKRVMAARDVPDSARRELVSFAVSSLMKDDPVLALELLDQASSLFEDRREAGWLANAAIHHLARTNPVEAVGLLRQHDGLPALNVTEQTRMNVVVGAALNDPARAFRLMGELEISNTHDALRDIAQAGRTMEQKTAVLNALREYLPSIKDGNESTGMRNSVIAGLASTFSYGNFGEARQWMESSGLTSGELAICAGQLRSSVLSHETGQWMEWFGSRLSPEDTRTHVGGFMDSWIGNDYPAATAWLSSAPAGPVKDAAISRYIEVVCRQDPESAARQAMTLPEGKERDLKLAMIYRNWPAGDSGARDAFAEEHGLR